MRCSDTSLESPCHDLGSFTLCPERVVDEGGTVTIHGDELVSSFAAPGEPGDEAAPARRLLPRAAAQPAQLHTAMPIVDAIWRLALQDVASLRRSDTVAGQPVTRFDAGESWAQAWARDASFAIDLGLVFIYPEETRGSLDIVVARDAEGRPTHVQQDACRHFGGWPNLTDRIVWALGASEWRKAHGGDMADDVAIVAGTLARAEQDALDPADGLFRGVATFMESHSAYPERFRYPDGPANHRIGETKALSTNVLHAAGYRIAARMAAQHGAPGQAGELRARGATLERAIVDTFGRTFLDERPAHADGGHAYFVDEHGQREDRFEALGSLLACRTGLVSDCAGMLLGAPRTPYGTPSLWPPYPAWLAHETDWDAGATADYYHNGMIWPFVEGYAGWMAARAGNTGRLLQSIGILANLAGRDLTHHELHHWHSGRPGGSRAQLWSAAGYIGLVLRGVLGLALDDATAALRLAPNLPAPLSPVTVSGIRYRDALLTVTLRGAGTRISEVTLDGAPLAGAVVPPTLSGPHVIEIELVQ